MTLNAVDLTCDLIRCASITPLDEGAQELLAKELEAMGFECTHLPFEDVPNLFARLGTDGPHICYAGHTDVVPPGPEDQWTYGPFNPHIDENGVLFGRGASDMKSSVAAFPAAVSAFLDKHGKPQGSISLLITGDEEGVAINGTVKVLEWMRENNHIPDVCLVGEPTNPSELGEEIKIGRRGSFTGEIRIKGTQGHVAYPHRSDNPLPRFIKLLDILANIHFDDGSDFFAPTNLEITTIDVGNVADNVIPGAAQARFNIRFNDHWSSETLEQKIREELDKTGTEYELDTRCGAESFITKPGEWSDIIKQAVIEKTGRTPELTTTGGTSDARFVQKYCPVAEFGVINQSIHQIDENARVSDIEQLTEIYERILELYFKK